MQKLKTVNSGVVVENSLNRLYNQVLTEVKPKKKTPKTDLKVLTFNGVELETKQKQILAIAIKQGFNLENNNKTILNIFYNGFEYTDEKTGVKKVATHNGIRYGATNRAGNSYIGIWNI